MTKISALFPFLLISLYLAAQDKEVEVENQYMQAINNQSKELILGNIPNAEGLALQLCSFDTAGSAESVFFINLAQNYLSAKMPVHAVFSLMRQRVFFPSKKNMFFESLWNKSCFRAGMSSSKSDSLLRQMNQFEKNAPDSLRFQSLIQLATSDPILYRIDNLTAEYVKLYFESIGGEVFKTIQAYTFFDEIGISNKKKYIYLSENKLDVDFVPLRISTLQRFFFLRKAVRFYKKQGNLQKAALYMSKIKKGA